jgi:tetratricopeptide (TPR) repeat protein/DNA-binding transcriptional ArsR family regulator
MAHNIAVTRLLADKTNITILLLLRTQPLHCRKLSTILQKSESQIARKLSQLEKAGILKSEWVHKDRNIKVYFLKIDKISIHITDEGIEVAYIPEKEKRFFPLESIFQFNIPEIDTFVDRENQLALLDQSSFAVLTGIAGIGKTSLASFHAQRLKDMGKKVFWHTFSELDSTLFVVKKLAIFLSTYNYPQVLNYLKADGSDMRVIEALLKECMSGGDFAFFFDDYHLVADNSMDQLFTHLKKSQAPICVMSRYTPPFVSAFDSFAQIRLGEMEPEAVRALLECNGVSICDAGLKKISQKIGGHPLILTLLCHAADGDPDSLVTEIPPFEISTYLWEEIYSKLSFEEQHVLMTLSIFRTPVTIEAIQMVCSVSNVRTVIRQLVKKNLLKNVDGKYSHHAVTRMFCLDLVHDLGQLHQKAAVFHLSQETPKDIIEAVYHFVEGGAYSRGTAVVLDYYVLLINEGYADALLSFCTTLDTLPENQQLKEVEGEIYMLKGAYDAACHCFEMLITSEKATASLYRKLGEVYEKKREYTRAEELFLQGMDQSPGPAEEGSILVNLASVYTARGEHEKALSACEKALTRFSESGHKKGIAHVYHQMGGIFRFNNTEKALELLFSSLKISEEIGDTQNMASTLVTVGNVLFERGQTDEAVTSYEKSLTLSEQIGDIVGVARCCNNIGVKYALEWKWPYAMEYYYKTLSICKKIHDKKGIAFSYCNLGRAYSRLGLFEKALEYFHASLDLREQLSDKMEISYVYYNIGLTCEEMGDFCTALQWIEKSLHIREDITYDMGVAHCYESMGKIYSEQGDHEKALHLLKRALAIHEREKGTWMAATTRVFSAHVYVNQKDFENALRAVKGTPEIFEHVGNINLLVQAHQVAAEAYIGLENMDQALIHAETSLQYAVKMGSPKVEGRSRRILGMILFSTGDFERAEEEFRLSIRLLKKYHYERAKTYLQFGLFCKEKHQEKYRFILQKAAQIFRESGAHDHEASCMQHL